MNFHISIINSYIICEMISRQVKSNKTNILNNYWLQQLLKGHV